MGEITLNDIVTALGIIIAIITPAIGIYKFYKKTILDKFQQIDEKLKQYDEKIEKLEQANVVHNNENILLIKSVQACLKGLKEKGCNGPVTEAISNIDEYLLKASH